MPFFLRCMCRALEAPASPLVAAVVLKYTVAPPPPPLPLLTPGMHTQIQDTKLGLFHDSIYNYKLANDD